MFFLIDLISLALARLAHLPLLSYSIVGTWWKPSNEWTFKLFAIPCQDLGISFLLWAKFLLSPFLIIGCWIVWVRHSDKNPFSGVIIERSCWEIFQLPVQRSTDLIAKCKNHRNTSIIWTSHKPAVIKKNSTGILTLCNEVNCLKF